MRPVRRSNPPFPSLAVLAGVLAAAGFLAACGPGNAASPASPSTFRPQVDEEVETTWRPLTWDDFKGTWTRRSRFDRAQAYVATGIRLDEVEIRPRQLPSGEWVATAEHLVPYAYMLKYESSYARGANIDRVLAHEQGHFDLTEAVARRLRAEFAGLEGRGATAEAASDDLSRRIDDRFDAAQRELDRLQSRYDGETGNGTEKKKQKRWLERIAEMLAEAAD